MTRKTFLIDTSVLLYDKQSVHSFADNHVVLPMVVLDELDRFKEKQGILGESARYINRFLDSVPTSAAPVTKFKYACYFLLHPAMKSIEFGDRDQAAC